MVPIVMGQSNREPGVSGPINRESDFMLAHEHVMTGSHISRSVNRESVGALTRESGLFLHTTYVDIVPY